MPLQQRVAAGGGGGGTNGGSLSQGDGTGAGTGIDGGTGAGGGGSTGDASGTGAGGVAGADNGSGGTNGSGPAGSDTSGSGGGGVGGQGAAPTSGGSTRGLTKDSLRIGVVYPSGGDQANAAVGAAGISKGDVKAEYQALIDDVNSRGGIAGRKLVYDPYPVSATSTDIQSAFNAACQHFTKDSGDFAVLGAGPASFNACLEKAGVLHLGSDLTTNGAALYRDTPHLVEPSSVNLDRRAQLLVPALASQGYFGGKLGVITFNDPQFSEALNAQLLPGLRRAGHPADQVIQVAMPAGFSDYGALSSAAGSAVLQFRSRGIDHVLIVDAQGVLTLFFLQSAESQHYNPRYGVDSHNGLQALLTAGDIPKDQLKGAVGVGWLPTLDVIADNRPANAESARCLNFFRGKGLAPTDDNSTIIVLGACQDVWLLARMVSDAGADASSNSAMAALDRLGTSFASPAELAASFGPAKHDGAGAYRLLSFDVGCGCIRYVGDNRPIV